MTIGLDHFDMSIRWARMGLGLPVRSEPRSARWRRPLSFVLPIVLVVGAAGVWLILPASDSDGADGDAVTELTTATVQPSAALEDADTAQSNPVVSALPAEPRPAMSEPPPAAKLRISGQSWQRAGLGSNAQATFTLRNDNAYAVKDIEIACAFARRDGTHLTARKRLIPVTVDSRSRKRFARLHIGFVNVYANRINCSIVAASRV